MIINNIPVSDYKFRMTCSIQPIQYFLKIYKNKYIFNWDSLNTRLNSHYEAWTNKKKKYKKDYRIQKICLERNYSSNISGLKTTQVISQRKAFYMLRIPEFSRARKETVDIDILVTFRNGHRKIMQSIRITSRPPSRKRKWNQLSQF